MKTIIATIGIIVLLSATPSGVRGNSHNDYTHHYMLRYDLSILFAKGLGTFYGKKAHITIKRSYRQGFKLSVIAFEDESVQEAGPRTDTPFPSVVLWYSTSERCRMAIQSLLYDMNNLKRHSLNGAVYSHK